MDLAEQRNEVHYLQERERYVSYSFEFREYGRNISRPRSPIWDKALRSEVLTHWLIYEQLRRFMKF